MPDSAEVVREWQTEMDPVVKKLLSTTDAKVWAEEWCRIAREIAKADDDRDVIDEGWMIGWFANAIEVGRSAGGSNGSS